MSTLVLPKLKEDLSSPTQMLHAELNLINHNLVMLRNLLSQLRIFQSNISGMMSMEPTSLPISETNMFHNIVVHAGLMQLLQLCLIELRLPERQLGLILTLLHKFLFLVLEMMDAMEVKHIMLSSGCQLIRLLMKPAQSIELEAMIMVWNAQLWQYA